MRFGKSKEEALAEGGRGDGGGGEFMRYLGDGDNMIQVIDEPGDWKWYWEHFNPGGYPFPCLSDDRDNCPGCTSDDERMAKASRKVAFNAVSWDDQGRPYVHVWKVPKSVAETLELRYDRQGTVTNRPYLITRFKKDNGFFDYDVEGQDKQELEYDKEYWRDPEELLVAAYEESWGTSTKVEPKKKAAKKSSSKVSKKAAVKKAAVKKAQPKPEPEAEVSEAELREMEFFDLVNFCKENGFGQPEGDTTDEIVDWMLEQQ